MKKSLMIGILLGVAFGLGVAVWGHKQETPIYEQAFFAMDTIYRIQLVSNPDLDLAEVVAGVRAEVARIEALTSRYATASGGNVAMINAQAGLSPVEAEKELFELLMLSRAWSEQTKGDFSITLGPLLNLWRQNKPPSAEELALALQLSNDEGLVLNQAKSSVFLAQKGMSLDLGAVAKGYALDRAKATLLSYGVKDGMIDGGGSIVTLGVNAQGQPWQIGLAHPRRSQELISRLAVSDLAVISSGDYQRYFEYEGKRYHHIIDPHTGYPAEGMVAVTILASSATVADILSTAVFVGGTKKMPLYREAMTGALLIDDQLITLKVGNFGQYETNKP